MRGDDAAHDAAAVAADRAANPDRDRVNECDASLLREREEDHRVPKIAEPIRTWVAPSSMAMAKFALMPIDSCLSPLRFAIFAVSAKCGAGASSTGGMHINPEIVRP